jgi:hypothetical protein
MQNFYRFLLAEIERARDGIVPRILFLLDVFGRLWCDSEKTLIVKDSQLAERKKA